MYGIFTYIYHKHQLNVGKYTPYMDGMGGMQPSIAEISFFWISWIGEDKIGLWFWARAPFGEGRPSLPNVGGSPTNQKDSLQIFIAGFHSPKSCQDVQRLPRNTLDGFQIRLEAVQLGGVVPFIGFLDVKVLSSVSWENGGFNLGFLEMPEMLRHKCLHPDGMPGFLGATCIPYIHKWNIMSTKN